MSRISLELVPDVKQIEVSVPHLRSFSSYVSVINIPDLPDRFSVRSWEACASEQFSEFSRIAHVRASDCDPDNPLPFADAVNEGTVTELLVVSGDHLSLFRKQYTSTVFDVLKRIRNELPQILVYAAFDPYRTNIHDEIMYTERKIEAGFDGLFTQPFFNLNLLRFYQELFSDKKIYWGLCPVIADGSRSYWEKRNKVIFPHGFKTTLDWNIKFGRDFLKFVNDTRGNVYIMPIRIPLQTYLPGIFG